MPAPWRGWMEVKEYYNSWLKKAAIYYLSCYAD
jgi:hypothetical protein